MRRQVQSFKVTSSARPRGLLIYTMVTKVSNVIYHPGSFVFSLNTLGKLHFV